MKKIIGFVLISVVLFSCGGNKENRTLEENVSAFLKDNKTIIAFGKADVNTLLNKTEYKKIPKLGLAVSTELEAFKNSLNTETPIFFALEGPFLEDGTPATTYLFFDVVNSDSLSQKITQQGFDLEKANDIEFFQSGDVAFGIKKNIAVLISKKDEFDGKKILSSTFGKFDNDVSEGKIDEILGTEGDIVLGMNIENLYGTSNTDLADLSEEKQKSIKELVADSYIQTSLHFDEGSATVETKNLFSDALKGKMFFKSDKSGALISRLGTGSPKIGFSMNLDMKKVQSFLDEYSPNTLKDLGEMMGGPASFILATGGDDALAGLISGELGVVMVGEPNANEGLSDFNFFVGLGPKGKSFAEEAKGFLSMGMAKVDLNGKGISAFSSMSHVPMAGKKLNVPKGCEMFGTKGITAFLYLDGVDLSSFEFENEQKVTYLIKYVTFEMDENGSKLFIKAKDGKGNLLKQAMDVVVKELSDKIGNLTL